LASYAAISTRHGLDQLGVADGPNLRRRSDGTKPRTREGATHYRIFKGTVTVGPRNEAVKMPEGAPACKSVGGGSREPASLGEARFCSGANVPFGIWRGPPEVILAIVVRVSRHVGALPQR